MSPGRLLQYFEQISEAPDAVPRLRRFVLDLAVRGKIVEQAPADEPAAELLKHIWSEKERLTGNGKIRRSLPQPEVSNDEAPYTLPKSWIWSRLGEVIHLVSGQHLQPNEYSDQKQSGPPYITGPADFGEKGLVITRYATVRKAVATEDQILLTVKGAGVGKTAVCDLPEVAISRQLMAMTAIQWSQRFLLLTAHRLATALRASSRSLIPGISRDDVEQFVFGLPPLAEQQRIVAKVDELMALCDELEAAQAKRERRRDRLVVATLHGLNNGDPPSETGAGPTFDDSARFYFNHLPRLTTRPEHIHQLRQIVLSLAVRGKLVPQDPKDESAANLLLELRDAKDRLQAEEGIRDRKPVEHPERSGLGYSIPDSWERPCFDDLFVIVSGVTKGRNLAGRKTIDLPYLRVANVQRDHLDLAVMKTIRIPDDELPRYRLRRHDVLMTEGGDWDKLGRAAVWMDELPECIHQNHVFRVRPPLPAKLLPRWVVTYANSALGRAYFEDASKQTTNLASINMTQLRGCPLPLPPLAEQHRIVAKVDELMALCDELETRLTTTATTHRQLLESTLHEALEGGKDSQWDYQHAG